MTEEKPLPWGLNAKALAPGSMKNLTENKLKAFNIGSMAVIKGTTKKELEDIKKKKEKEEAEEVYKEFVESFEQTGKGINKSWIKGGLVHPEKGEVKTDKLGNKIYKPTSKLLEKAAIVEDKKPQKTNKQASSAPKLWTPTPLENSSTSKKKTQTAAEKRKTNLELFKEELKVIQEERQERRKIRQEMGLVDPNEASSGTASGRKSRFDSDDETIATGINLGIMPNSDDMKMGSFTYENDTQTTNLYLGNINPKMTEMQICEIFGKFGPLASVKIMWPRTDEEKSRGRNCGFVAYMNRKDAERAYNNLQGKDMMEFEMKLGWGKSVPIPPHPIYIPPALSELTQPPPPSGQPFNAQPMKKPLAIASEGVNEDEMLNQGPLNEAEEFNRNLANSVVKVVIPTEKVLLHLIHRMIEFVVREGPMFEAMIMNREISNPLYRFLFENQSPAHVYYRWKLYSILQGDSPFNWRCEEFHMFIGGSLWRPPQKNLFSQGMPDELVSVGSVGKNHTDGDGSAKKEKSNQDLHQEDAKKNMLSDSQRDRLEDMLRELIPERAKIGDCMVWCLEHAEYAEEIVECIAESLSLIETPIPKKVARLFLISDLLHNSSTRVIHASFYRRYFEQKLPEIFKDLHDAYEKIDARLKAEQFKQKVMTCFRAWEDWAVYTSDYLINLQNIFLGLVLPKGFKAEATNEEADAGEDVDGIPLDELDGMPISDLPKKEADEILSVLSTRIVPYIDDLDGEPMESEENKTVSQSNKFKPSKWETVDESELEAQAMTVSKWDLLDQKNKEKENANNSNKNKEDSENEEEDDIDGIPLDAVENSHNDMEKESSSDSESIVSDNKRRRKHEKLSKKSSKGEQDRYSSSNVSLVSYNSPKRSRVRDEDEDSITCYNESSSRKDTSHRKMEISESKRAKLREIEVKVMKYQDELENGKRSRKSHLSISQQVDEYRNKLLKKDSENSPVLVSYARSPPSRSPSVHMIDDYSITGSSSHVKKKHRHKSPKKSNRRSNTPAKKMRKSKSRSKSPTHHKSKKSKHS